MIYYFLKDDERAPSPDQVVVLSAPENLGPTEEAEAEFAKELAKMVMDSSTESRKVDKKTALALWDSAVLPPAVRKKRADENGDERSAAEQNGQDPGRNIMNFTVITKRGNKPNVGIFCPIIFLLSLSRTHSRLVKLLYPLHLPWRSTLVLHSCRTKWSNSI